MRRLRLALFALLVASPATAQEIGSTGLSANDVAGLIPPTCDQPPAPDAMAATSGAAAPCVPRADAARQTQVPPATSSTTADGTFSGTWGAGVTLPRSPTKGVAVIFGTATPYHCQLATLSPTDFTGKCWSLVPTTLPALPSSLLGLVVSPVANPAAGLTVHVFARY